MWPLALSCEKSVPGVDPLSLMNVVVVVDELSVAGPLTCSVVAWLFCGLVPSSSVPVLIDSGPVVELGLAIRVPPAIVSDDPSVAFTEPGLCSLGALPM